MIKGTFKRNDSGQIVSFTLTGHAEAGPYGSDIVCAGVSALAISTINGINALAGTEPSVEANEDEGGYLRMSLVSGLTQEQTNIEQILLENLLLGLQSIEKEQSEYIQISTIIEK
ncbi:MULTISPECIES: ribosomal-processing cysteine protease Prp [Enterococcus]|uniref:ribosomal-processing cysteine protease Prp n=1 Tax=Enterococcus TaxID=1350 RepID=UPI00065E6081|nr:MULTISPECIES: ribosomal-processing cysteine protease Prp [Enterococcus]KAF1301312.1 hypothetical protein BAU16_09960 [Enterococcus sp. JM9B]